MHVVEDMAVEWYHGYGNHPELHALMDSYFPYADRIWHPFPVTSGTMWIARHEPLVSFMLEPTPPPSVQRLIDNAKPGERVYRPKYGGALGGKIMTEEGETTAYQCWSSNEGSIHDMVDNNLKVADLLPYDIVDITIHEDREGYGWGSGGMAGLFWDKPWVERMLERFLPRVRLFESAVGSGELDAAQSMIVGKPKRNRIWIPYDRETGRKMGEPYAYDTSIEKRRGMKEKAYDHQ